MTTKEDFLLISDLADRALALFERIGQPQQKIDVMMDIENTHKIIPLKLVQLTFAPETDFVHDMVGIYNNFNRRTKQMDNCFSPRYARQS